MSGGGSGVDPAVVTGRQMILQPRPAGGALRSGNESPTRRPEGPPAGRVGHSSPEPANLAPPPPLWPVFFCARGTS